MWQPHFNDQSLTSALSSVNEVRGSPLVGDHSISPYLSSHHGGRDSHMDDSFRRTPSSLGGSRSSLASALDQNSSTAGKTVGIIIFP